MHFPVQKEQIKRAQMEMHTALLPNGTGEISSLVRSGALGNADKVELLNVETNSS